MTVIRLATLNDLPELTTLFDSYRVFYKQKSNPSSAYEFLEERIQSKQSIIFLAFNDNTAIGFTQLYPSYSSVSLQTVLILNDLYVAKSHRKQGIGEALLNKTKAYCKKTTSKDWP